MYVVTYISWYLCFLQLFYVLNDVTSVCSFNLISKTLFFLYCLTTNGRIIFAVTFIRKAKYALIVSGIPSKELEHIFRETVTLEQLG